MTYDIPAEKAVLGCILLENSCLDDNPLVVEDFYLESHRRIFKAILKLHADGKPVDQVTLAAPETQLVEEGRVPVSYLMEIVDHTPSSAAWEHYCEIVKDKAVLRQLAELGQKLTRETEETQDTFALLDEVEQSIQHINTNQQDKGFQIASEIVPNHVNEIAESVLNGKSLGLMTGFSELDRMTGGLHGGEVMIVAARPGLGKTTLALNMGTNMARGGTPGAVLSLEMSAHALQTRIICAEASIDSSDVKAGRLDKRGLEMYQDAAHKVEKWPLYINDNASTNMIRLKSQARRLVAHGVKFLIIDYLQLLRSGVKGESRYDENTNNSRDLHNLAGQLKIPIICLSQLNRSNEKEGNRKPRLSDLRETGAIEQDADIVAMIHAQEESERCQLLVRKNRGGAIGNLGLRFEKIFSRFVEDNSYENQGD